MLQLSQLTFPQVGSISKDLVTGEWGVTERPLTYNMNELVTSTGYPPNEFPTASFLRTGDYFTALAEQHMTHFQTQRNLAISETDTRWRFTARHFFTQLVPEHCAESFSLFCDDLRPANMLADPETLRITAVLDLEFTNAMPAQFACDPPWWLLLQPPHTFLERGERSVFLERFVPRMEQFIRAVERAEQKFPSAETKKPFSVQMRESWDSGRF